ncbi:hypothetical protein FRACYDRAFT_181416 [Fragilariopsis cylindrus CCMP1102]|uniref:Uncharacterized protein n=1 Tax=Fragilariopsis cylindrus CCMP1102 TaxID=635003 RepID=A0A1E7FT74_9STRA|nr:hypothetical protein FRACYDRAFT_181416 [Fragilariopsis cylindrus CCMP1102]|eukprot:OEU21317.1 hypothetical protein FRACYDRAFT_181416 [Fragilariopsis cylindrus CCMP1102]
MTLKSHNADRNYRLRFFQTSNNSSSYSNINSDSNPHENRSRKMKNHNNTCTTCTTNNNPSRNNKMHHLRYDWTNLTPSLDMTKHIIQYQSNCSLPMSTFTYRNRFGLGSDLHVYSQALCNGIKSNRRIRTIGNWTFMDQSHSSSSSSSKKGSRNMLGSPMRCYFASSELNCPGDVEYAIDNPGFDNNHSLSKPNGNVVSTNSDCLSGLVLPSSEKEKDNDVVGQQKLFQVAVIESLFTRLTPLVVDEAERQLNLIFGGKEKVPKDLITVHVRWGKEKVNITEYIDAVYQILEKRNEKQIMNGGVIKEEVNIFLATEDPKAVVEFRNVLPIGWNLFVDQFLVDTNSHRIDDYNGMSKMTQTLHGKTGLLAMGSLLVAMEANDFVLTTASNWSRLMDELRLSIINPRCGNCTSMIDLRQ